LQDGEPEQGVVADEPANPVFYTRQGLARELRQSEIISNLAQFLYDPVTLDVESVIHPFAIVVTQDCDLLWDYESRTGGSGKALPSVLLYAAESAASVRPTVGGSDIWRRVIANNNERYHLLQRVPVECDTAGLGVDNLVLDFKSFFTLTPQDIYGQCKSGTAVRRCRLEMPYREHLQTRAAFYLQRVTLPAPHEYAGP